MLTLVIMIYNTISSTRSLGCTSLNKKARKNSFDRALMDDFHFLTARHFRYELRLGGKFSAAIWSAGGVPRITSSKFTAENFSAAKVAKVASCQEMDIVHQQLEVKLTSCQEMDIVHQAYPARVPHILGFFSSFAAGYWM